MNFANTFTQNIRTVIADYTNRNARKKAVRSALMSVMSVYPEFAGVGFDEQFMTNKAAEIMEPFLSCGSLPTRNALTKAWAAQFPYSDKSTKRAVANITPMATEFIDILTREASAIPVTSNSPAVEQHVSTRIDPSRYLFPTTS